MAASATIFHSPSLIPITVQRSLSSPTRIHFSPRILRGFHSLRRREYHRFSQNVTAGRFNSFSCNCLSAVSTTTLDYEFTDGGKEVELRLRLKTGETLSPKDISVDADGTSLSVKEKRNGLLITLLETNQLFDKIMPSETIWYIDEDQLVVNMKKVDGELKWPDVVESWESLTAGMMQLLKGASIYVVGDSTEINQKVSRELAVGLGYSPLDSMELLESFSKQTIDSWILAEGADSVAEAESSVLESLSSHVRTVVSTLGGKHGAAGRADKWRHLYSGFTVWVSQTEATDEESAKEEARRNKQEREIGYSNADVVVKLQGWDPTHAKSVAQASLSALKQLIISDKGLPGTNPIVHFGDLSEKQTLKQLVLFFKGKKSLYIRLGCRGDWPNIKPPGWDPSSDTGAHPSFS